MLDTTEMRKWADSQYDQLGGTAYSRIQLLLTECDNLIEQRRLAAAALRRVAAGLVVLAEG